MSGIINLIDSIYEPLYKFWDSKAAAKLQSTVLVSVFLFTMIFALLNNYGVGVSGFLGEISFFQSVEISFTVLLFFEMISLVFVIPFSIANSIGKQIEILSLVLLRSSFKEFAHFIKWFQTESGR